MSVAFLFPGQGSQSIGMGKEIYENFSEAKEVFQEVDEVLKQKLSSLIFGGDIQELTQTQNAQPAIMAVSMAVMRVLEKQSGKKIVNLCNFAAGHSLGEYSAHAAAGTFSLRDTAKLLQIRGNAMQSAAPAGIGGMIALVGAEISQAEQIASQASQYGICGVANDNGGGQIVLSGEMAAIDKVPEIAGSLGVRRAIKLNVSSAFHSELMKPAAAQMAEALQNAQINASVIPVICNIDVKAVQTKEEVIDTLTRQVTGRVRWREIMEWFVSQGVTKYIEVGPGKVLSGIAKRMAEDAYSTSISTPSDIEEFIQNM